MRPSFEFLLKLSAPLLDLPKRLSLQDHFLENILSLLDEHSISFFEKNHRRKKWLHHPSYIADCDFPLGCKSSDLSL